MYKIKGIVRFTSPDLDKLMIYMGRARVHTFFDAPGMIFTVALKLDSKNYMQSVQKIVVKSKFSVDEFEIMNWRKMLPDL